MHTVQPNVVQPQMLQAPPQQDPMGWLKPLVGMAGMFFPEVGMASAAYDFLRTGRPGPKSLLGLLGVGQQQGMGSPGMGNPFLDMLHQNAYTGMPTMPGTFGVDNPFDPGMFGGFSA